VPKAINKRTCSQPKNPDFYLPKFGCQTLLLLLVEIFWMIVSIDKQEAANTKLTINNNRIFNLQSTLQQHHSNKLKV
jgi:hypothetical protein